MLAWVKLIQALRVRGLHWWLRVKNLPEMHENTCNAGDCLQCRRRGFSPWVGRISWRRSSSSCRNGNPFQHSCLEHPMGRGALWATILEGARVGHDLVTKSPPPPKSKKPPVTVTVTYRGADHRTTKWNPDGALPGRRQHMLPHQMTHQANFTNKGYFPIHLFAFIPSFPISRQPQWSIQFLSLC